MKANILDDIDEGDLRKSLGINDIDKTRLVPSLKPMLSYISLSTTLVMDDKLRQALQGYIRNDVKLLGHIDFNLLVHNEYYTADSDELKKVWNQIFPLLDYFVTQIKQ